MTSEDPPGGPFAASLSAGAGRVVVVVEGEVDATTAPRLQSVGAEACAEPGRPVVLDVRGVTFVDSAGLNALIAVHRLASARGSDVRIVYGTGSNAVLRLLRMVGLDGLFDVDPSER